MGNATSTHYVQSKAQRFSYGFIAVTLILLGWLHLATPFLAVLFAYLALDKLNFLKHRGKWASVVLLLFLLTTIAYGLGHFVNEAVKSLPEIADKAIPLVIDWARHYKIELPFSDYDSLKEVALDTVKSQSHYLGSFAKAARGATTELILFIVGCIVAIGLFVNPRPDLDRDRPGGGNNLYSRCAEAIAERFRTFYQSFSTVLGAQIIISAINTVLTTIFVLVVHLPYAVMVIGATFVCGLLPVIGNLVSNTIIVGIAITVSPKMALGALVFLVVVHKLEYFLNSKIVGERIRNPFWLTLLALIVGERLMGIPGMILAPVVLHYVKLEASKIRIEGEGLGTEATSAMRGSL